MGHLFINGLEDNTCQGREIDPFSRRVWFTDGIQAYAQSGAYQILDISEAEEYIIGESFSYVLLELYNSRIPEGSTFIKEF